MATKTKMSATATTEAMREGMEKTVAATKANFEKAAKGFGDVAAFNKANIEAVVASAKVSAKSAETINSELLAFSKQSIEDGIAAAKAMMGAKSLKEFFEIQTDYSKSAFDSMVNQMTKMADMVVSTSKEAVEPINGRVTAVVELVQKQKAA